MEDVTKFTSSRSEVESIQSVTIVFQIDIFVTEPKR